MRPSVVLGIAIFQAASVFAETVPLGCFGNCNNHIIGCCIGDAFNCQILANCFANSIPNQCDNPSDACSHVSAAEYIELRYD